MEALLSVWQMKMNSMFDVLREENGEEPFNVIDDHRLSDLRHWEEFAQENYQPSMPKAGVALVSVLTLVSVGLLARTWG